MSRRALVIIGVLLLVALASGVALKNGDDKPSTPLTVGWDDREEQPGCVYDPKTSTVNARITITGDAPHPGTMTVTVTAYADENTSIPVGSNSGSVRIEGSVHKVLPISIPVTKPPQIGEDDVAACARTVKY